MSYSEPGVSSPYRSLRDALLGVRQVNNEAPQSLQPLHGVLCETVCRSIRFLADYYGPTLTESGVRVVATCLDAFRSEVAIATARIDTTELSASEKLNLEQALQLIESFRSAADT